MKKRIVFLFPTVQKRFGPNFFFTFTGQNRSFCQRVLYPFAQSASRIDWKGETGRAITENVYPSTLMRSLMQAEIVARHAPEEYEVLSTTAPHMSGCIVILNKFLINKRPLLHYLKLRGNTILADMVDGRFKLDARLHLVDGLICCSHKGRDYYASAQSRVPVFFVEHCIDARLPEVTPPDNAFSAWYFGAPQNLYGREAIEDAVHISYTESEKKPATAWIDDLPKANFHYAVRPKIKELRFKPFTKGGIAAWCKANILVHKDDGDALRYLGEEYPYLIREELGEEVVRRYLAKAREDFGGERWRFGLSIMRNIRERYLEQTLARQFWTMIQELGSA